MAQEFEHERHPTRIREIHAREILDSRGVPTVEVDVTLENGRMGRASVPTGTSTGSSEAAEVRDHDATRFHGLGVRQAIRNIDRIVTPIIGHADIHNQLAIDDALRELDGTPRKEDLGANAILAVSLAVARASASTRRLPLFRAFGNPKAHVLPVPLFVMISGGMHADNDLDVQEFLVAPVGASTFRDALRAGSEVYTALRAILRREGLGAGVGDEGGFVPLLRSHERAFELILLAIEVAGFRAGTDVVLGVDVAGSALHDGSSYAFRRTGARYSSDQLVAKYLAWLHAYPIGFIEDGMAEHDWQGWRALTEAIGERVLLVGDDLFATHADLLRKGVHEGVANAILVKPNQVGTLSEAIDTMGVARAAGYSVVVSHRSGETTDDFIADFAVATGAHIIKAGAPCRGERVAKYNRLARIEEELGERAIYAGRGAFACRVPAEDRSHHARASRPGGDGR